MTLVLDAGALVALERGDVRVFRQLKREQAEGNMPLTHGGVIAQVWRGGDHRQVRLARALAGVEVLPLDDELGRTAGMLLARSSTTDAIDAAVVAIAANGDQILTSDPIDIGILAALSGRDRRSHPHVTPGNDTSDPLAGDPRSMRERMLAGDLYLADDAELLALRLEAARRCFDLNTAAPEDVEGRRDRLRGLFGSFGDGSNVLPRFHCDYGIHITIGERTFINVDGVFLDTCAITIGDDVQIAPKVQLLTATHPLDATLRMAEWESGAPIALGDGVWLGGGVIVCPGVTIGERTVVGAGTVVTKDLPPDVLAVGNPARVVRSLS